MDQNAIELRDKLMPLLDPETGPGDDRELLEALEPLARDWRFPGLSHEWVPVLYERNRRVFRAFVLAHMNAFGNVGYYDERGNLFDPWKSDPTRSRLTALLSAVELRGDVAMFRRLYEESIGGWWKGRETWVRDVRDRFDACATDGERRKVLELFDLRGFELDEATAIALYDASPKVTAPFVIDHAVRNWPWASGKKSQPWESLIERALARGDEELAGRLFRRQATEQTWAQRVREISEDALPAARMVDKLELHHPEAMLTNAGTVYLELLNRHGEAVLPYVQRHLALRRGFWFRRPTGADKLIRLASDRGWLTLWAGLVRASDHDTYDRVVARLVDDRDELGRNASLHRLRLLAGVGLEVNYPGFGLAQVIPLSDDTATALYRAHPELLRGPFRKHVTPAWGRTFPKLVRAALETNDEALVDWLASRALTLGAFGYGQPPKEQLELIDVLSRHYEALLDDAAVFARRAGSVLSAVPAHAIFDYRALTRNNRLARLLFERTHESYLVDEGVVRDLLESPQIFVNRLAYLILAGDDPRARKLAAANVDMLLSALLRKLHRQTRVLAFDALGKAITTEDAARKVLPRARDALRLPDKRYPKDKLVALIGEILHRYPALRGERERPVIFGLEAQP